MVPRYAEGATQTEPEIPDFEEEYAVVPMVQVCLLQSVRVPPRQRVLAKAQVESSLTAGPVIFEPDDRVEQIWGAHTEDAVVEVSDEGSTQLPLVNPTGFTVTIQAKEVLGHATEASIVSDQDMSSREVKVLTARMTKSQCRRSNAKRN